MCVKCLDNHLQCSECEDVEGYVLEKGLCVYRPETIGEPVTVARVRYDLVENKCVVVFNQPVLFNLPAPDFTECFMVSVHSDTDDSVHRCRSNQRGAQQLGCKAEVTGSGFEVSFSGQFDLLKGKVQVMIASNSTIASAKKKKFLSYPVVVDGFSLMKKGSLDSLAAPLAATSSLRPLLTQAATLASAPSAAILDKFMGNIGYLRTLEGRILVFPEKVFAMASSMSTFIPLKLFDLPEW